MRTSFLLPIVLVVAPLAWGLSEARAIAQPAAEVIPPQRMKGDDPAYPASELESRKDVLVVLAVTIDSHGHVTDTRVLESGGAAFDEAAQSATLLWTFSPGTRSGTPVATRIRVPIHFTPPPIPETPAPPPAEVPRAGAQTGHEENVLVHGRAPTISRGASDFEVNVGDLARVPRQNAAELLKLAPGILLTNEGGEGHANQVFLRGFDAREGQDVEFTVGGVPINETGNLHANGYADTHFILPELVESLRVLEGPFDPRQGNFAVAGSADYRLGLAKRGLTAKYTAGSFSSRRLVLLWGPKDLGEHTFAGGELASSAGFGQNRASERASAMAQYEGKLSESGSFRLTGQAYATDYKSAGLIRQDDYLSGAKGFYDSYDANQGGNATRFSVAGDVEQKVSDTTLYEQIFLISRGMRVKENFTGFLLDVQSPAESPHSQRGDLIDRDVTELTLGSRGFSRTKIKALDRSHDLEFGYLARYDQVQASQYRVDAATRAPYKLDIDLDSKLANIGLYSDINLHALSWLSFRGGVRGELFAFNVLNNCAVKSVRRPSAANPPGDASCLSQSDFGKYREPVQRNSTASTALLPRVSMIVGPFDRFSFTASYGQGIRSIDPTYVYDDTKTPFASIDSYESGVIYTRSTETSTLVARSVFFQTHVDQDLIFNQSEGRNTLANGTTRTGWIGALRYTNSSFDESANVTLVRSTFDDTHLLVPYVPDVVVRSDTAYHHALPVSIGNQPITGSLSSGITFVGQRALPFGDRSNAIFTLDAGGSLSWDIFELGLTATNLTDQRYRLGEYNFASNWDSAAKPTLVPMRHFSAGAPRALFVSLSVNIGGT